MTQYAIKIKGLNHFYKSRSRCFLAAVDQLNIPMGSLTTLLGPSGCGKSTVQNRLGLLSLRQDEYSTIEEFQVAERDLASGCYVIHDVAQLLKHGKTGQRKIEALRRRNFGFFLQSGELIPTLTIKENVAMPLRLNGVPVREAYERAEELLGYLLGVSTRNIPNKLALDYSGGEAQRVALARAIAHKPQILFVDEPTSSLDTRNKKLVLDLMMKLVRDEETTVVMINHDEALARSYSDFIVNFDANPKGWGDRIPQEFRECDGFGQPVGFEANIDGIWMPTDCDFQVEFAPAKGEQHVA